MEEGGHCRPTLLPKGRRELGEWSPLLLNSVKSVEGEPPNFPLLKEGGEVPSNLAILERGSFLERWVTIYSSYYFQREDGEEVAVASAVPSCAVEVWYSPAMCEIG